MSSKKCLIVLTILALISRLVGLGWGQGYFFHPDENNMATAVSGLSLTNLNPHFFAYGQFPLYLAFFSLFPITGNYPSLFASILALRFWSAIFSLIYLFFAFKIGQTLFKKNSSSFIFLILLIFSPGLIQLAHFGTTESILCIVFTANLYFSVRVLSRPHLSDFLLAALFTGIGLSSKITAIFFILPLFLAAIFTKKLLYFFTYLLISLYLFVLFSPYNWIDFKSFFSTISYETAIAFFLLLDFFLLSKRFPKILKPGLLFFFLLLFIFSILVQFLPNGPVLSPRYFLFSLFLLLFSLTVLKTFSKLF
ncbi:MAG: Glycosyltransferase family 83 domain protein [Microgenomates group bacterium GW2011_GWA2_40_6]|nr:MAG: Glycosyltransferase family 83 domain protein [Microgenomates group bacterium GW2011_GWA2_40_6]